MRGLPSLASRERSRRLSIRERSRRTTSIPRTESRDYEQPANGVAGLRASANGVAGLRATRERSRRTTSIPRTESQDYEHPANGVAGLRASRERSRGTTSIPRTESQDYEHPANGVAGLRASAMRLRRTLSDVSRLTHQQSASPEMLRQPCRRTESRVRLAGLARQGKSATRRRCTARFQPRTDPGSRLPFRH